MYHSYWPHGLQHAGLPCPLPSPRVCSNPCPLSRWCHPTISSSVPLFSSHLQSFSASGSFPMGQLFDSGGPSTGASASASVLPMNIQDWSPLGWTGWLSLQSKDSQESSPTPQFKNIDSSQFPGLVNWRPGWDNSYSPSQFQELRDGKCITWHYALCDTLQIEPFSLML